MAVDAYPLGREHDNLLLQGLQSEGVAQVLAFARGSVDELAQGLAGWSIHGHGAAVAVHHQELDLVVERQRRAPPELSGKAAIDDFEGQTVGTEALDVAVAAVDRIDAAVADSDDDDDDDETFRRVELTVAATAAPDSQHRIAGGVQLVLTRVATLQDLPRATLVDGQHRRADALDWQLRELNVLMTQKQRLVARHADQRVLRVPSHVAGGQGQQVAPAHRRRPRYRRGRHAAGVGRGAEVMHQSAVAVADVDRGRVHRQLRQTLELAAAVAMRTEVAGQAAARVLTLDTRALRISSRMRSRRRKRKVSQVLL